jgi:hypothetical protein
MILTTSTTGPSLKYYRLNDAWDITHTGIETDMYADGFGNYSAVRFNIRLQRRPSFYVITMLLPVFLLSLSVSCVSIPYTIVQFHSNNFARQTGTSLIRLRIE